jgi:hypothetical protein
VPEDLREAWARYESVRDRLRAEQPEPDERFRPDLPEPERDRLRLLTGHPDAEAAANEAIGRFADWHHALHPPGRNSA